MPKNEKTGKDIGKIASKVLRGEPVTKGDLKSLAGSALTQRPNENTPRPPRAKSK